MGGIIIGSVGLVKIYSLQRKVKQLTKEKEKLNQINGTEIEKENDVP
jgi:hypothetical protein